MKLVFLFGNCAVGKMTVGQALCDITRLKLFHNHMTIEPVIALLGDYKPRAVARLRDVIFEEFAASDQYGMVFTYMWAFDQQAGLGLCGACQADFRSLRHGVLLCGAGCAAGDSFAAQCK